MIIEMNNMEKRIQNDLATAIKNGDKVRVDALRSIKAAIQNEKTNGSYHELTDDDVVKLIQKLSKQRKESYDIYVQANRDELANKELAEKTILDEYLPKMLSEDELNSVVDSIIAETGASTMKDMGNVMKTLSSKYPNQYDGKLASTIIRGKLS